MRTIAYVLGAVLIAVATFYFLTPADHLPSFMPGAEAGVARIHVKHGVIAAVAGAALFVVGWFAGRRA
jgi:hypothetical protein